MFTGAMFYFKALGPFAPVLLVQLLVVAYFVALHMRVFWKCESKPGLLEQLREMENHLPMWFIRERLPNWIYTTGVVATLAALFFLGVFLDFSNSGALQQFVLAFLAGIGTTAVGVQGACVAEDAFVWINRRLDTVQRERGAR